MSRETLLFLRAILCNQQLQVGAEDFRVTAQNVITALAELDAALELVQ